MAAGPIVIPYAPRALQAAIHAGMDAHRFGAVVCHRRFGKTVLSVNHLQKHALVCRHERPRFAYLAPTYTQGKAVAWDYMRHYSAEVPGRDVNESELRIDYPHGGQVRLFGADNPDSLRGLGFDGVVLDEYGLMPPRTFSEVVRPTLSDRSGWALFMGTPNGKNQFYDVIETAKRDQAWFYACYKASETGIISDDELRSARESMTEDEYLQEYECSFEASVKGAVYGECVRKARADGQITAVPYDPMLPVDTDWDLGVGDATAIWFSQSLRGGAVHLIDYAEGSGYGLNHWRQVLNEKAAARGFAYGTHWGPHDIQVRELGTGHSRIDSARSLGLNFQVCPRIENIEDGIHAARMLFPKCWFDATHCQRGIEALQHYRWKLPKVADPTGRLLPVHDWASHGADAFRGLAYRWYENRRNPEVEAALLTRLAQKDADPYDARMRAHSARRGGY